MNATFSVCTRNQSMDLAKLIASFFVVFLHVPFPGQIGQIIGCLARFAVPLFFILAGYFSFQASSRTLLRRAKHILVLIAAGSALHIFWQLLSPLLWGGTLQDGISTLSLTCDDFWGWLLLNINPFAGHLWFLSALFRCYLLLWLYTRIQGASPSCRPLYWAGLALLLANFLLGQYAGALGLSVPYQLPRSTLLTGIPLLCLGIFLREYSQRIALSSRMLAALMVLGGILSLWQQHRWGPSDLSSGIVILSVCVVMLLSRHPNLPLPAFLASRFGPWSTGVYLVHLVVLEYYRALRQYPLQQALGAQEALLQPIWVLGVSLLVSILFDSLALAGRRLLSACRR